MSHFTEIKTNFLQKHEKELIQALKEHLGENGVEVHEDPVELLTYYGAKASEARELGRTKKCHLVIRKKAQQAYA